MVDGSFSSSSSASQPMLVITPRTTPTTIDPSSSSLSFPLAAIGATITRNSQYRNHHHDQQQQQQLPLPESLSLDIPSAVNSIAFASVPTPCFNGTFGGGGGHNNKNVYNQNGNKQEPNDSLLCSTNSTTTTWIACGCRDGSIQFWNSQMEQGSADATAAATITLKHHTRGVPQLVFSPSSTVLASASLDGKIRLWKMNQIQQHIIKRQQQHQQRGDDPSFDSSSAAPRTRTTTAAATDAATVSHVVGEGLGGRRPAAYTLAFSPNGQQLACASLTPNNRVDPRTGQSSNIAIWSIPQSTTSAHHHPHELMEDASNSSSGCSSSSSSLEDEEDKVLVGEDMEEEQCLHRWGVGEGNKAFMALAYYDHRYLTSCRDNEMTVTVWDLEGDDGVAGGDCGESTTTTTSSSPNCPSSSSSSSSSPTICTILTGHSRSICQIVASPPTTTTTTTTNRYLATASNDGTVRLWDIPTGTCVQVLGGKGQKMDESGGFASPVRKRRVVAFRGGGGGGCAGDEDEEQQQQGDEAEATTITTATRPGRGGEPGIGRRSGENLQVMGLGSSGGTNGSDVINGRGGGGGGDRNHRNHALRSIAFDPTGTTLASARLDGMIRIWKVSDGTCLSQWTCQFDNMFLSLGFCTTASTPTIICGGTGTNNTNDTLMDQEDDDDDHHPPPPNGDETSGGVPSSSKCHRNNTTTVVISGSSGGKIRFDRVCHQ